MGGFIVLEDGRAHSPASWAYDAIIEAVACELDKTQDGRPLAEWLRQQTCEICGPGLGSVDIRELTPDNHRYFRNAAERAFAHSESTGPQGWHDPALFPGWLEGFRKLIEMWRSIDRGEPPEVLNGLAAPLKPTHKKSGPGW